jgi:UDP-N-acetylglucosamine 1-carboxyvinyltransferase
VCGATENTILSACLAEGVTTINNAAREPEIIDLQNFLNKMGAKVKGAGTNTIEITGVKQLKNVDYNIMSDRIEAGTFLVAGAATGGYIQINNISSEYITPIINKLEEANCKIKIEKNSIELQAPKKLKAVDIRTMPYPGFPTDMQSVFGTCMTVAKGTTVIVENIFENRFGHAQQLKKMGADIRVSDKKAFIRGKKLYGAEVSACDLRSGAALIVAALGSCGETIISNCQYIDRGYEDFEDKFKSLGVDIERMD